MRATSLPLALPVAAAAMYLMAAVLVPLAVPSTALAERWLRPVPGDVVRSFSYTRAAPFAPGAHRGVDLAARPGTPIRSACGGTVIHAGPVAGRGRVVSMRCGGRRVSYLPLASVAVRAGATIRAGAPIGTAAAGHGGLHLGVRREPDRFGYEDPLQLLGAPGRPEAPAPVAVRRRPPHAAPRPVIAPPEAVHNVAAPRVAAPVAAAPRGAVPLDAASDVVAPWPVWAGLALLLAGAAGSGRLVRRRRAASRSLSSAIAIHRHESAA